MTLSRTSPKGGGGVGVLKNAKVERISYSSSIGTNKTVSIGFSSDLDPEDLSKGLFLSGFVNT